MNPAPRHSPSSCRGGSCGRAAVGGAETAGTAAGAGRDPFPGAAGMVKYAPSSAAACQSLSRERTRISWAALIIAMSASRCASSARRRSSYSPRVMVSSWWEAYGLERTAVEPSTASRSAQWTAPPAL